MTRNGCARDRVGGCERNNIRPGFLQVLVTDPEKLEAIRARESDITKERIRKILDAGANVILATGGIDDLCLKLLPSSSLVLP